MTTSKSRQTKVASKSVAKRGIKKKKASRKKKRGSKYAVFFVGASDLNLVEVGPEPKLELREQLAMSRDVFCRLVNVSVRAIADVEGGKPVKKLVRPYTEVQRLYEALSEVVDPEAIGPWFLTPNEKFDGSRPIDLVERGEIDRLWRMVYRLRSGMPG